MGIKISEGSGENNYFLNKFEILENMSYLKIAYVEKIVTGNSVENKSFYKFILKDVEGCTVVARLFNVENMEDSGNKINGMVNSLVKISFDTSRWNNDISLTLTTVDPVDTDIVSVDNYFKPLEGIIEARDYTISKLKDLSSNYDLLKEIISKNSMIDKLYENSCELWYERKGGAILITSKLIKAIEKYAFSKDVEDRTIILAIVGMIFRTKSKVSYLKESNDVFDLGSAKLNVIKKNDDFWSLFESKTQSLNKEFASNLALEGRHLFGVIMDIDKAKTFSTLVIEKELENILSIEKLYIEYKSMINNSFKIIEDTKLVKLN